MKLHEIKRLAEAHHYSTEVFKDCNLWLGVGSTSDLDSADVEVEFEYEPSDYTDLPYGSTTARDHHGSNAGIISVKLMKDTNRMDDDGEAIGVLKKGTDLTKEKWWKAEWSEWLADKCREKMDDHDPRDDFDEPDHGDHEYR